MQRPTRNNRFSDFSAKRLQRLWIALISVLLASLLAEIFVPLHGYFTWDSAPFFHAAFGFAACAAIVLVSNLWGWLVKRPEAAEVLEHMEKNT